MLHVNINFRRTVGLDRIIVGNSFEITENTTRNQTLWNEKKCIFAAFEYLSKVNDREENNS